MMFYLPLIGYLSVCVVMSKQFCLVIFQSHCTFYTWNCAWSAFPLASERHEKKKIIGLGEKADLQYV